MSCTECNGTGYVIKTDILKAKRVREVCPKCLGIPDPPKLNPNGIRHCALPYQPYMWQEFRDGTPIATLMLMICPVMVGRIQATVRDGSTRLPRPRIYAKIWSMNTRPEYRRQGIMDRLLICATQDARIEWLETSWSDSTEEGKNFLLHRGFKKEGDKLIFVRPEEPCKN